MAELTVAMTYARALFQAAKELSKEKRIADELCEMESILENDSEFVRFLSMPSISAEEKKSAVQDIFGAAFSSEFVNFMCILVEKGRVSQFNRIAREYKKLHDADEGFSSGIIYSAIPLTPDRIAKFEEETGRLIKEKVRLENEIDESMIGGIRIQVSGKIIDASIKSRVSALADTIIK